MLSERLKERQPAETVTEQKNADVCPVKREDAERTLDTYLRGLVEIMRAIAKDKVMTSREVEDYIISIIEKHEETYFKMSDDEFERYLFFKRFQRAMK